MATDIKQKIEKVLEDKRYNEQFLREIGDLADDAINEGTNSSAYTRFIDKFFELTPGTAKNFEPGQELPGSPLSPEELERLLPKRNDPFQLRRARAYFLGDVMCGAGSTGKGKLAADLKPVDEFDNPQGTGDVNAEAKPGANDIKKNSNKRKSKKVKPDARDRRNK